MSNETKEPMGDGQPSIKKIVIQRDWITHVRKKNGSMITYHDGEFFSKIDDPTITLDSTQSLPIGKLELSLPESLRVIEATAKYLNQTKNEGRHEIRTIKDKENQKLVDDDIHRYATLKKSLKSLELQIHDGENRPIEFIHRLQDSIKQHKLDITHLEIKYKYCTGRDIPYKQ